MKLRSVLESGMAWQKLIQIDKDISASFMLAKYFRDVVKPEIDAIEEQRQVLIKKYGEQDERGDFSIQPNTDEMRSFVKVYNKFLEGNSSVKPVDMTFDDLIGFLEGSRVSESVLLLIEPFFKAEKGESADEEAA